MHHSSSILPCLAYCPHLFHKNNLRGCVLGFLAIIRFPMDCRILESLGVWNLLICIGKVMEFCFNFNMGTRESCLIFLYCLFTDSTMIFFQVIEYFFPAVQCEKIPSPVLDIYVSETTFSGVSECSHLCLLNGVLAMFDTAELLTEVYDMQIFLTDFLANYILGMIPRSVIHELTSLFFTSHRWHFLYKMIFKICLRIYFLLSSYELYSTSSKNDLLLVLMIAMLNGFKYYLQLISFNKLTFMQDRGTKYKTYHVSEFGPVIEENKVGHLI